MPAIVNVFPEPVCPYMKMVEQPPLATLASSGEMLRAQSASVVSVSPYASHT